MPNSISKMANRASAIIMTLVLICGGMGLWAGAQSSRAVTELVDIGAIVQHQMEADMMHDAIRGDITAAFAASDPALGISLGETRKDLQDHIANFKTQIAEANRLATSPEIVAALGNLKAPLNDYIRSAETMLKRIELDPASAASEYPRFSASFKRLESAMAGASDAIQAHNQTITEKEHRLGLISTIATGGSAVLCLIVLVMLGVAVRRKLVRPLEALSETARAIAKGNYTTEIYATEREDELGTMANALVELRQAGLDKIELEKAVFNTVKAMQTGSNEIAQASGELARRTELQAASLEQTVMVMENLAGSVRETAVSANDVSQTVSAAQEDATVGGSVVRDAVDAMGGIEKSSQEIGQIISVIDAIAFQTNLLALNAGVEAARAGDAGKGFAVVANEVRALAQRSADAAKDIKVLITASSRQVQNGVKLVAQSGDSLQRIVGRITEVATLIHQIAAAADEQATGLQQINTTINDMGKSTQQNAAMVEQSNAACRNLADQATQLNQLVEGLHPPQDAAPRRNAPAPAPVRTPAPATATARPAQRAMPQSIGNLALAAPDEDDWTEF